MDTPDPATDPVLAADPQLAQLVGDVTEAFEKAYDEVLADPFAGRDDVPPALARVWANNPPKPERLAEFLDLVPELFARWDAYDDSEGPVQQASALIELSNHLFHMKNSWEDLGDGDV